MILKYELKKILKKRVNQILITAALILMVVFSIFAMGSFRAVDANGKSHVGLTAERIMVADKNRWDGELSPETITKSVKRYRSGDQQSTSDIIYLSSMMLVGENSDVDDDEAAVYADDSQIASIYDRYRENLQKTTTEYGDTSEKQAFLEKIFDKFKTPFHYEAYDPWDTMILYASQCSLILVIVIGFLTAGIFSEEFQCKSDSVFFSTKHGRGKAVQAKILSGFIIATMVYGIGIGVLSAICFGFMGISGASTAYQISEPYAIYPVTMWKMYGIVILCGYIASILSASIAMLVASKTKSISFAVAVPFVLFCVTPFIGRVLPFRTFFSLTPDQLTNIVNCARIPYIYQIGNIVFRQIPFLIAFYALVAVVMLPLVYRNYHRAVVS